MKITLTSRALILITMFAATALPAIGQQKTSNGKTDTKKSLERKLMDLQRQEDEAEAKQDVAALDRLFTDDPLA